jgi:hypothetical protein
VNVSKEQSRAGVAEQNATILDAALDICLCQENNA